MSLRLVAVARPNSLSEARRPVRECRGARRDRHGVVRVARQLERLIGSMFRLDGRVLLLEPYNGGAVEALLVVMTLAELLGDPTRDLGRNLHSPHVESPSPRGASRACVR